MEVPRVQRGGAEHLQPCARIWIEPVTTSQRGTSRRQPDAARHEQRTPDLRCSGCGASRVVPLTYIDTPGDRPHIHAADMRFRALWKCASCGLRSSTVPRYSTVK